MIRLTVKKAYITAAMKSAVFAANPCCVACGTWDAYQCDHYMPESLGGETSIANLIRMCDVCNGVKGSKFIKIAQFAQYTESRELIETRRKLWLKTCGSANIAKPYRPLI
jgi:5-methylcytosine-specific restriction endonuclease McrA